ncbi:MAG: hypothetical protein LHV68_09770 [Elusimicrobia bacterium]|nr:hypothetical protein [Candidatus Liberimonas magnetica]
MILCLYLGIAHASDKLSLEYGIVSRYMCLYQPVLVSNSALFLRSDTSSFRENNIFNQFRVKYRISEDIFIQAGIISPIQISDDIYTGDFNYSVLTSPQVNYRRTYKRVLSTDLKGYQLYVKDELVENGFLYGGINYYDINFKEAVSKSLLNLNTNQNQVIYDINNTYNISGANIVMGVEYRQYVYKGLYAAGGLEINTDLTRMFDFTKFTGVTLGETTDGSDLTTEAGRAGIAASFNINLVIGYEF